MFSLLGFLELKMPVGFFWALLLISFFWLVKVAFKWWRRIILKPSVVITVNTVIALVAIVVGILSYGASPAKYVAIIGVGLLAEEISRCYSTDLDGENDRNGVNKA